MLSNYNVVIYLGTALWWSHYPLSNGSLTENATLAFSTLKCMFSRARAEVRVSMATIFFFRFLLGYNDQGQTLLKDCLHFESNIFVCSRLYFIISRFGIHNSFCENSERIVKLHYGIPFKDYWTQWARICCGSVSWNV